MSTVGKNLKRLREARHLSVEDVRRYLRLGSVQAIYKYEKGKGYPQADTMFALMELYGANLYDIVHEREEDLASSSLIFTACSLQMYQRSNVSHKKVQSVLKYYKSTRVETLGGV